MEADDLQARRMSASENLQREDLSPIETIEAMGEMVDAELMEEGAYHWMGKTPLERVSLLLNQFDTLRRNKERGYHSADQWTSHKFMGRVEAIFKNLPKPLEWRSFYNNDLPLLRDLCPEVQEVSIRHRLNKSQSKALGKLKAVSEADFQRMVSRKRTASVSDWESGKEKMVTTGLNDLSARAIEAIAEKHRRHVAAGGLPPILFGLRFEISRSAHHDHDRHYDRHHRGRHDEKLQRALYHGSKHAEPSAFWHQIHPVALWALSGVRLTNFRMHGAKIDFSRVLALILRFHLGLSFLNNRLSPVYVYGWRNTGSPWHQAAQRCFQLRAGLARPWPSPGPPTSPTPVRPEAAPLSPPL